MRYMSAKYDNDEQRDAYGKMAEEEPDSCKWVGKIDIDVSGEVPTIIYKEVI